MALTSPQNEISPRQDGGNAGAVPSGGFTNWPNAVNRLWFHRRRIAWWVVLGLLGSGLYAFKYCNFESVAQLMPPDNSTSSIASQVLPALSKMSGLSNLAGSGMSGLTGDLLGGKNSGALFAKILESRTIEDRLVDRFDLLKRYGYSYRVDARKQLHLATKVEEDKKSGVLTITVRDKNAQMAAALANAYIEELDRLIVKVATSSAHRERIFIEQRLGEEKTILKQAEERFSQFSSTSMALDVPQQIRVTVESAARLQGELIAARAELEGLRQIYSPENNRLLTLTARVAELERQLRKINSGRTNPDAAQDPTFPYPSVKNLPLLGVRWADLYRETKIHETVFEMLTQQYEIARIQEAKETPTVRVLDAPVTPEKRYPRPWLILLLGTIISTGLACGGVLLQDKWETWDVRDPRRILLSNMYSPVRSMWAGLRPRQSSQDRKND